MTSTFTHAGVSRLKGEFKVRFANDALRVKVLQKNGHEDIDIVELKQPMTKEEAIAYLISIDFANGNAEVQAALDEAKEKREPKAPKEPKEKVAKEPKAKKEKVAKVKGPSLEDIAARAVTTESATAVTEDDDVPF